MICDRCSEEVAPPRRPRFNEHGRRRARVHAGWDGQGFGSMLRLRGKWLARLGFEPGTELEIEEQRGRLVIRAV